ncbi:MAG: hypothetical protein GY724_23945 [Actinomycetia bacterium]|nr:hypothetical protein [Actinomycetes bacterium]MCP4223406.1 hypothetical protein [Actinomycetes bacterium]MCP5034290.1 hypothetical protein [Actinomycetes bacterium]
MKLTVGMILVVGLSGCGRAFSRQDAIDSFMAVSPEATSQEAACVVDNLIDRYSLDQLEIELAADPPDAGFEEAQFREMFRCGIVGDVEQQVTEQLTLNGVEEADAPCVAERLVGTMTDDDIDVLLSGEISEQFSTKFLQAMDACDALNP